MISILRRKHFCSNELCPIKVSHPSLFWANPDSPCSFLRPFLRTFLRPVVPCLHCLWYRLYYKPHPRSSAKFTHRDQARDLGTLLVVLFIQIIQLRFNGLTNHTLPSINVPYCSDKIRPNFYLDWTIYFNVWGTIHLNFLSSQQFPKKNITNTTIIIIVIISTNIIYIYSV